MKVCRDGDDRARLHARQAGKQPTSQAFPPVIPLGVRGKRHVVHRHDQRHTGGQRRRVTGRKEQVGLVPPDGTGQRALLPADVAGA